MFILLLKRRTKACAMANKKLKKEKDHSGLSHYERHKMDPCLRKTGNCFDWGAGFSICSIFGKKI